MRAATDSSYSWPRPSSPLPSEKDFDPYDGNLDCQHALEIFGGMSLDQAYEEFCDKPEIYQEDFMFMGPKAFIYYFPVIDRYLREVASKDQYGDCEVSILAYTIKEQLDHNVVHQSTNTLSEIHSLTEFILAEITRYSYSKKIRKQVRNIWMQLADKLAQYQKSAKSKNY